jgi:hypothetical protein
MRLPGISFALLLGLVLAVTSAGAQTESPGLAGSKSVETVEQIYARAKPYMDAPLPDLKHAVAALDGLRADASQSSLESVLSRTGEVMGALLPKMPSLAARESVSEMQFTVPPVPRDGNQDGVTFLGRSRYTAQFTMDERQLEEKLHTSLVACASWKDFDYLMQSSQSPAGFPILEESRTEIKALNGGRSKREQTILHGVGFGYVWLLFLPQNIPQSRYRILGRQKMNGHDAYVVAFAQLPDRVKVPAEITLGASAYPLLYQGIAWIDEATFRIVRLETDLLAPLPSISLQRMRSDLLFSEVRIPDLSQPLWLPKHVELTWRQGDQLLGEMHLYTKYRLFNVTVKMLPPS